MWNFFLEGWESGWGSVGQLKEESGWGSERALIKYSSDRRGRGSG